MSKIDPETGAIITVDFILVTAAMIDVWVDRKRIQWDSGLAWVVSRRGLIKMKKKAGRPQDLVDIKNLEEADDPDEEDD